MPQPYHRPQVSALRTYTSRPPGRNDRAMGNFRETLWFKKGELDIQAAQDPDGLGAADLLPVEDRYADDGTLAPADTAAFGVHSGQTQSVAMVTHSQALAPVGDVPPALVSELKRGRLPIFAAIGGALVVLALIVAML